MNTPCIQKLILRPKDARDQPIHLTNVYCKPEWDRTTVRKCMHDSKVKCPTHEAIEMGIEDYNIRIPDIGDEASNMQRCL